MQVVSGNKSVRKIEEDLFPWLKVVRKKLLRSFPEVQFETLQFLHKSINEEFKKLSNSENEQRERTFYKILSYFYLHFYWKSNWNEECHLKSSCVQMLYYMNHAALILSDGCISSKWLNRAVSVLKSFPGDPYMICDALLLLRHLKNKYHAAYAKILKSVLSDMRLRTPLNAECFVKTMLLFRRLKSLIKYKSNSTEISFAASRVKCPSGTKSWLLALNIEGLHHFKCGKVTQTLLSNKLEISVVRKLLQVLLANKYDELIDLDGKSHKKLEKKKKSGVQVYKPGDECLNSKNEIVGKEKYEKTWKSVKKIPSLKHTEKQNSVAACLEFQNEQRGGVHNYIRKTKNAKSCKMVGEEKLNKNCKSGVNFAFNSSEELQVKQQDVQYCNAYPRDIVKNSEHFPLSHEARKAKKRKHLQSKDSPKAYLKDTSMKSKPKQKKRKLSNELNFESKESSSEYSEFPKESISLSPNKLCLDKIMEFAKENEVAITSAIDANCLKKNITEKGKEKIERPIQNHASLNCVVSLQDLQENLNKNSIIAPNSVLSCMREIGGNASGNNILCSLSVTNVNISYPIIHSNCNAMNNQGDIHAKYFAHINSLAPYEMNENENSPITNSLLCDMNDIGKSCNGFAYKPLLSTLNTSKKIQVKHIGKRNDSCSECFPFDDPLLSGSINHRDRSLCVHLDEIKGESNCISANSCAYIADNQINETNTPETHISSVCENSLSNTVPIPSLVHSIGSPTTDENAKFKLFPVSTHLAQHSVLDLGNKYRSPSKLQVRESSSLSESQLCNMEIIGNNKTEMISSVVTLPLNCSPKSVDFKNISFSPKSLNINLSFPSASPKQISILEPAKGIDCSSTSNFGGCLSNSNSAESWQNEMRYQNSKVVNSKNVKFASFSKKKRSPKASKSKKLISESDNFSGDQTASKIRVPKIMKTSDCATITSPLNCSPKSEDCPKSLDRNLSFPSASPKAKSIDCSSTPNSEGCLSNSNSAESLQNSKVGDSKNLKFTTRSEKEIKNTKVAEKELEQNADNTSKIDRSRHTLQLTTESQNSFEMSENPLCHSDFEVACDKVNIAQNINHSPKELQIGDTNFNTNVSDRTCQSSLNTLPFMEKSVNTEEMSLENLSSTNIASERQEKILFICDVENKTSEVYILPEKSISEFLNKSGKVMEKQTLCKNDTCNCPVCTYSATKEHNKELPKSDDSKLNLESQMGHIFVNGKKISTASLFPVVNLGNRCDGTESIQKSCNENSSLDVCNNPSKLQVSGNSSINDHELSNNKTKMISSIVTSLVNYSPKSVDFKTRHSSHESLNINLSFPSISPKEISVLDLSKSVYSSSTSSLYRCFSNSNSAECLQNEVNSKNVKFVSSSKKRKSLKAPKSKKFILESDSSSDEQTLSKNELPKVVNSSGGSTVKLSTFPGPRINSVSCSKSDSFVNLMNENSVFNAKNLTSNKKIQDLKEIIVESECDSFNNQILIGNPLENNLDTACKKVNENSSEHFSSENSNSSPGILNSESIGSRKRYRRSKSPKSKMFISESDSSTEEHSEHLDVQENNIKIVENEQNNSDSIGSRKKNMCSKTPKLESGSSSDENSEYSSSQESNIKFAGNMQNDILWPTQNEVNSKNVKFVSSSKKRKSLKAPKSKKFILESDSSSGEQTVSKNELPKAVNSSNGPTVKLSTFPGPRIDSVSCSKSDSFVNLMNENSVFNAKNLTSNKKKQDLKEIIVESECDSFNNQILIGNPLENNLDTACKKVNENSSEHFSSENSNSSPGILNSESIGSKKRYRRSKSPKSKMFISESDSSTEEHSEHIDVQENNIKIVENVQNNSDSIGSRKKNKCSKTPKSKIVENVMNNLEMACKKVNEKSLEHFSSENSNSIPGIVNSESIGSRKRYRWSKSPKSKMFVSESDSSTKDHSEHIDVQENSIKIVENVQNNSDSIGSRKNNKCSKTPKSKLFTLESGSSSDENSEYSSLQESNIKFAGNMQNKSKSRSSRIKNRRSKTPKSDTSNKEQCVFKNKALEIVNNFNFSAAEGCNSPELTSNSSKKVPTTELKKKEKTSNSFEFSQDSSLIHNSTESSEKCVDSILEWENPKTVGMNNSQHPSSKYQNNCEMSENVYKRNSELAATQKINMKMSEGCVKDQQQKADNTSKIDLSHHTLQLTTQNSLKMLENHFCRLDFQGAFDEEANINQNFNHSLKELQNTDNNFNTNISDHTCQSPLNTLPFMEKSLNTKEISLGNESNTNIAYERHENLFVCDVRKKTPQVHFPPEKSLFAFLNKSRNIIENQTFCTNAIYNCPFSSYSTTLSKEFSQSEDNKLNMETEMGHIFVNGEKISKASLSPVVNLGKRCDETESVEKSFIQKKSVPFTSNEVCEKKQRTTKGQFYYSSQFQSTKSKMFRAESDSSSDDHSEHLDVQDNIEIVENMQNNSDSISSMKINIWSKTPKSKLFTLDSPRSSDSSSDEHSEHLDSSSNQHSEYLDSSSDEHSEHLDVQENIEIAENMQNNSDSIGSRKKNIRSKTPKSKLFTLDSPRSSDSSSDECSEYLDSSSNEHSEYLDSSNDECSEHLDVQEDSIEIDKKLNTSCKKVTENNWEHFSSENSKSSCSIGKKYSMQRRKCKKIISDSDNSCDEQAVLKKENVQNKISLHFSNAVTLKDSESINSGIKNRRSNSPKSKLLISQSDSSNDGQAVFKNESSKIMNNTNCLTAELTFDSSENSSNSLKFSQDSSLEPNRDNASKIDQLATQTQNSLERFENHFFNLDFRVSPIEKTNIAQNFNHSPKELENTNKNFKTNISDHTCQSPLNTLPFMEKSLITEEISLGNESNINIERIKHPKFVMKKMPQVHFPPEKSFKQSHNFMENQRFCPNDTRNCPVSTYSTTLSKELSERENNRLNLETEMGHIYINGEKISTASLSPVVNLGIRCDETEKSSIEKKSIPLTSKEGDEETRHTTKGQFYSLTSNSEHSTTENFCRKNFCKSRSLEGSCKRKRRNNKIANEENSINVPHEEGRPSRARRKGNDAVA